MTKLLFPDTHVCTTCYSKYSKSEYNSTDECNDCFDSRNKYNNPEIDVVLDEIRQAFSESEQDTAWLLNNCRW